MIHFGLLLLLCDLFFFVVLWRREYRRGFVVTPFLVFVGNEIVFLWPAALYAFQTGFSPEGYPVLAAALGFLAFLLGTSLLRRYQRLPAQYAESRVIWKHTVSYYLVGVLSVGIFLFVVGIYHYQGIPPTAQVLRDALLGRFDPQAVAEFTSSSRRELTKLHWFDGEYRGQGLTKAILEAGWPYLLCVSILVFRETRRRLLLIVVLVLFIMSFIFIAGDGTRGPFMWSMVTLLVLASLIRPLRPSFLITFVALSFVVLIGMSFLSSKGAGLLELADPIREAVDRILKRLFVGNGLNTVAAIEFVRSGLLEYRFGGLHLQKVLSALPGVQYGVPFARELFLLKEPSAKSTTFATGTYLGVLYVDFGLVGAIVAYFLIGLTLAWAQQALFSKRKEILRIVLVAFEIVYLGQLALSGPVAFVTSSLTLLGIHMLFTTSARVLMSVNAGIVRGHRGRSLVQ